MAASNNKKNDNDITVVESESDDDSQSSEEFNFAVALQLRKNLSSTFEKHIHSSNVSQKIARFEQQQSNNNEKLPPRPVASTTTAAVPPPVTKSTPLGVYLRVRPISSENVAAVSTMEIQPTNKPNQVPTTVRTFPPVDSNAYKVVRGEESSGGVKEFEFAQVFGPDSSQQQVYNTVAAPLVSGLFPSSSNNSNNSMGESALLFAYGITNAGKTHTIMGNAPQKETRGIIPRAFQDIFSHMQQQHSTNKYCLKMSYMEIYNEGIYDLLPKEETTNKFVGATRESLKLRESRQGQTFVRGLAQHTVKSVQHGLELAQQASTKRHTSSNNINSDSSRSHCICQLEVSIESLVPSLAVAVNNEKQTDDEDDKSVSTANGYNTDDEAALLTKNKSVTLWIVDLAGSERSKRTGAMQGSTRQKEAALINSSLMKLMRCLNVMRRNQSTSTTTANVVPFRESKLTHLFMNHLCGPSANRTLMIVNVNPAVADFDETQHVLAYATAARSVQISQGDAHRKRKDMSGDGTMEATHDYNGRALKKCKSNKGSAVTTSSSTNGATSKISKLVKRFSPKKMVSKKPAVVNGDSKKRTMMESKRALSNDSVTQPPKFKTSRLANMRAQGKPKQAPPSQQSTTAAASNKEVQQLKMSLSVAQAEAEVLRSEKNQLEEQLSQQEAQVRMEIAQDMEEQMQIMREQYNGIIDNLKSQVHSNPTPNKSVKKAQMDKVDSLIDELMDKVDECEDEMKRMRESHAAEIASLEEQHGKALGDKDTELAELTSSHKQAVAKLEATIKDLQTKLQMSQGKYVKLEKSKKEMMENYEQLIREQDEEETEDEDDDADDEQESTPASTPVRRGRLEQTETSGTRRMVRSRTSKVAVQSMETENVPKSSGKKPSRKLRSKRTPLSPIAMNKNSSDSDDSEDSFGPDQWLRPKKPVKICEITGSFKRPKGRAPSGTVGWDERVGAWRLSMAG